MKMVDRGKHFYKDTKDCIEQLYKHEILKKFSSYGICWDRFIGVNENQKTGYLRPYGLIIPPSLRTKAKEIRTAYLEFSYAHYTLFCHLAGAHFQLKELKKSLRIKNAKKRHFRHWEHFEVFYLHLGICIYQVYHLWALIFLLEGRLKRDAKGEIHGAKKALKELLMKNRKKYLSVLIDKMDNKIKILRDNITHFARGAHRILPNGDYAIPYKIKENVHWDGQLKTYNYIETTMKAKTDLDNLESLFDRLHKVMIIKFQDYMLKNKIVVRNK